MQDETRASSLAAAEADLRASLADLRAHTPLAAAKLATEEEGLCFEEIRYLRELFPRDLKAYVKIGGPCARADIRHAAEIGAEGLIAPMVESVYGLQRFIQASRAIFGDAPLARAFNMETVTAYEHLDELLGSEWGRALDFVNIGRSDLAGSLGEKVDSPRVTDIVCDVVQRSHAAGLPVHVGGTVTVRTLEPVLARTDVDGFHTRWLAFDAPGSEATEDMVQRALHFEVEMLKVLALRFPHLASEHLYRAEITAARLER